jgi:hypothetical protein
VNSELRVAKSTHATFSQALSNKVFILSRFAGSHSEHPYTIHTKTFQNPKGKDYCQAACMIISSNDIPLVAFSYIGDTCSHSGPLKVKLLSAFDARHYSNEEVFTASGRTESSDSIVCTVKKIQFVQF